MKKSILTDFEPDEDISELFNAQTMSVPENVRSAIFEQAEKHCGDSQSATSQTDESSAFIKGPSYLSSVWARGFGIAATLLLAVIITPLLLNVPESSLESHGVDSARKSTRESEVLAPTIASQQELRTSSSNSLSTSAAVRESGPVVSLSASESADADSKMAEVTNERLDRLSATAASASPNTARIQAEETPSQIAGSVSMRTSNVVEKAQKPVELLTQPLAIESANARKVTITHSADASASYSSAGDSIDTAELEEAQALSDYSGSNASDSPQSVERPFGTPIVPNYRVTADAWQKEIVVLIGSGKVQEARDEYRLFELQYPSWAKRFKPDFSTLSDEGDLQDNN